MSDLNPYAAPKATLEKAAGYQDGMWRDGKVLIMRQGAAFPHRCIKCNRRATGPLRKRTVYWHPAWVYLLLVLRFLPYLIVALIVRKKAVVELPLCERHQKRFVWGRAISILGFFIFAGLAAFAIKGNSMALPALVVFTLVWILVAYRFTNTVRAKKIDTEYALLLGCSPEFLASLTGYSQRWQASTDALPSGLSPHLMRDESAGD